MGGERHRGRRSAPARRRHRQDRDLGRPVRLLALDIDGTLLRSDKTISARTTLAIQVARERGVRLLLVTGRRYPAARRVADLVAADLPLVLHNGALIVESGSVVRCRPLARAVALRAIEMGRVHDADPVLHRGHQAEGHLVVEGIRPSNTLLVYYLDKSHPDVRVVDDLANALDEDPIQVMFGGSLAAMDAFAGPLAESLAGQARIERTVYPRDGVGILDIMNPTVNKAEALAFLSERWGVAADETLAIGDNWNDHEMLEWSGLGFVMGNADPEMLRLGLPVLPSNDEDGVAVAIERYVLGAERSPK